MHKEMNLFNIFSAWGWGSYIGTLSNSCECRQSSCSPVVDGYRTPRSSSWSRERAIWRECHCRFNSGGCLKSLNTALPRWRPFKWDIRFVVKTWCLFSSSQNPCWTYVANSNGIVLLCHREKLPDRRRHVHRWWGNERDTSWESLVLGKQMNLR